jgi:hypothetical protein
MLSNIWVWDPGSGKNLLRIPDPGVKQAPDPGSGYATLVVDPAIYPDPDLGSQTNSDRGQSLKSQKMNFYMINR